MPSPGQIQVVFECCTKAVNRAAGPGPRGWDGIPQRPDISITHCLVCESRHLEAVADAGQLGVKGAAL